MCSVAPSSELLMPSALNILVVEDMPSSQKLMVKILETGGHQVQVAENGLEAIRDFNRFHPNLVIMDLQMPVLDGLQTISILRALEDNVYTPIIAVTARKQNADQN